MSRRLLRASRPTTVLLLTALGLSACAPKTVTLQVQDRFEGRKYCDSGDHFASSVSDKALTKVFNIACWLYARQNFTFLSEQDTRSLYKLFGGKVEREGQLSSASGLTLPKYKLFLATSELSTIPNVQVEDESFFSLRMVASQLFSAGKTLSEEATLRGAGPIQLQDGEKSVTFGGQGEGLIRDVYSAPVGRALAGWQPYTFPRENVQGGAQSPLRHQIQTKLPPQTVVALVLRTQNRKVGNTPAPNLFYEVAEVGADGIATFSAGVGWHATLESKPRFTVTRLQLKGSLNAMQPAKSEMPTEADAVVIPVSGVPLGQIGQKAVTPVSPLSIAR
ncbi:hypothetical protein [Deinococcus aquaedulcis]|uniref:hypothetical protein n=1 Tax=Deinococcus aquaedulcis TaxID=2840455 RepID=UPI001C839AD2|nr:hypothetical protein [Deinococcus aquaedulcis]